MERTQDPKVGKPLYAKKGETVLYYKDSALSKQEVGLAAKDGNLIGTYVLATERPAGFLVYGIRWPSDTSNPIRYVRAAQTEWTSYKPAENTSGSVDLDQYDPVKDTKNIQTSKSDNTLLYLAIGLAAAVAYKFGPRS